MFIFVTRTRGGGAWCVLQGEATGVDTHTPSGGPLWVEPGGGGCDGKNAYTTHQIPLKHTTHQHTHADTQHTCTHTHMHTHTYINTHSYTQACAHMSTLYFRLNIVTVRRTLFVIRTSKQRFQSSNHFLEELCWV